MALTRFARVEEYWDWLAAALFLLTTTDMITTVYAVQAVGIEHEVNPVVRWSLRRGPAAFAGVNIAAVVLAAVLFDRALGWFRRTPDPYDRYAATAIEVWLGGLLAAGLLVFANNLTVVVHGRSLL